MGTREEGRFGAFYWQVELAVCGETVSLWDKHRKA